VNSEGNVLQESGKGGGLLLNRLVSYLTLCNTMHHHTPTLIKFSNHFKHRFTFCFPTDLVLGSCRKGIIYPSWDPGMPFTTTQLHTHIPGGGRPPPGGGGGGCSRRGLVLGGCRPETLFWVMCLGASCSRQPFC